MHTKGTLVSHASPVSGLRAAPSPLGGILPRVFFFGFWVSSPLRYLPGVVFAIPGILPSLHDDGMVYRSDRNRRIGKEMNGSGLLKCLDSWFCPKDHQERGDGSEIQSAGALSFHHATEPAWRGEGRGAR